MIERIEGLSGQCLSCIRPARIKLIERETISA